jgi:hypothetical protein
MHSDFTLISDPEFDYHPACMAFRWGMLGRAYGREAINDAWAWFKSGWEAKP